ncbi:MAG: VgrG-related protein [Actinomycetota bacterium]
MPVQQSTNSIKVEVNGTPLADTVAAMMTAAYVDDSLNLPDMFSLVFRDPDRAVLSTAGIEIGSKVTITVASEANPAGDKLLVKGEVTALEAEFEVSGTLTVVRGFDVSHRLFRGRRTEAYRNATCADIARKVAGRAGLTAGRIDASTPVYDHVAQANLSDWEFLSELARRTGYELSVTEGKLDFRKPSDSSAAPQSGTLRSDNPLQLTLGANLLRFRTVVTSAEQVAAVEVRGWSDREKRAVVGTAPADPTSATLGVTPAALGKKFGAPSHISVGGTFRTQPEADSAAKAWAGEIAGSFASFDGMARGNPKLRAGTPVSLGLVGAPFDGRYTLTTTRHVYDGEEGYTTWFTVSGRQERSLLGLAAGPRNGAHARVPGTAVAIVTDLRDPEKRARVKLKFPWLSDTYETDWARTVQVWAGNRYGAAILPEVGDEVLVAFEQGELDRPFVLGGLYNGKDLPRNGGTLVDGGGAVATRELVTRVGHTLTFVDDKGKETIRLATGNGGCVLELGQSGRKLVLRSDGSVEITADQDVTIKATGNLELSGRSIALKAQSGVKVDGGGGEVAVSSQTKVGISGAAVSVNGTGTTEVKASGILQIQGSLVKIN